MTVRRLGRACRRAWYLVLAGLLLTTVLGRFAWSPAPVYWAQSEATFLAPLSSKNPNALAITSDSIISIAGIVQRRIDNGDPGLATSSSSIKLYDRGIYDGALIRLPDTGGQWTHNFERAVLQMEVTGSDPAVVEDRMKTIESEVESQLAQMQLDSGANKENWIHVVVSPAVPSAVLVGGSRIRALAMSVLLGLSLTLGSVALWDRRRFGSEVDQ